MLLGALLTHHTPEGDISGIIVETEAYTQDDPASHTFRGQTLRNAAMFEPGGTVYIYFTYGMHYCVNFVCGPKGRGEGVLIRALQPIEGVDLMKKNRKMDNEAQLTNGPAKLVQALGIEKDMYNGRLLEGSDLKLTLARQPPEFVQTTRIGIKKGVELPRRFYVANNRYVSSP